MRAAIRFTRLAAVVAAAATPALSGVIDVDNCMPPACTYYESESRVVVHQAAVEHLSGVVDISPAKERKHVELHDIRFDGTVNVRVQILRAGFSFTVNESRIGGVAVQDGAVAGGIIRSLNSDVYLKVTSQVMAKSVVSFAGRLPGAAESRHTGLWIREIRDASVHIEGIVLAQGKHVVFADKLDRTNVTIRNCTALQSNIRFDADISESTIDMDGLDARNILLPEKSPAAGVRGVTLRDTRIHLRNSRVSGGLRSRPLIKGSRLLVDGCQFGGRGFSKNGRKVSPGGHAVSLTPPIFFSSKATDISASAVDIHNSVFDVLVGATPMTAVGFSGGMSETSEFNMTNCFVNFTQHSSIGKMHTALIGFRSSATNSIKIKTRRLSATQIHAPTLSSLLLASKVGTSLADHTTFRICAFEEAPTASTTANDAIPFRNNSAPPALMTAFKLLPDRLCECDVAGEPPCMATVPLPTPETLAPSTLSPASEFTDAPATAAPTPAPLTPSPVTPVPATPVPETPVPETPVPATPVPATPVPATPVPETPVPETPAPETPAPATPVPETPVPATPVPETPVPATPVPETPVPATPVPATPVPATPVPETPAPETPVPKTRMPAACEPRAVPYWPKTWCFMDVEACVKAGSHKCVVNGSTVVVRPAAFNKWKETCVLYVSALRPHVVVADLVYHGVLQVNVRGASQPTCGLPAGHSVTFLNSNVKTVQIVGGAVRGGAIRSLGSNIELRVMTPVIDGGLVEVRSHAGRRRFGGLFLGRQLHDSTVVVEDVVVTWSRNLQFLQAVRRSQVTITGTQAVDNVKVLFNGNVSASNVLIEKTAAWFVEILPESGTGAVNGRTNVTVREANITRALSTHPFTGGSKLLIEKSEFGGRGYSRTGDKWEGGDSHAESHFPPVRFLTRDGSMFRDSAVEIRNTVFSVKSVSAHVMGAISLQASLAADAVFRATNCAVHITTGVQEKWSTASYNRTTLLLVESNWRQSPVIIATPVLSLTGIHATGLSSLLANTTSVTITPEARVVVCAFAHEPTELTPASEAIPLRPNSAMAQMMAGFASLPDTICP